MKMIRSHGNRIIILPFLLCLFLFSVKGYAGKEVHSAALRGTEIDIGQQLSTGSPAGNYYGWTLTSSEIRVVLKLAEDSRIHRTQNATYTVKYQVVLTRPNNTTATATGSLSVNFNLQTGYEDIALNRYSGYMSVKLTVTEVSGVMPEDVLLVTESEVERCASGSTLPMQSNEVYGEWQPFTGVYEIAWNYMAGADRYELEFLFVDNPNPANLNVAYDFRNATRVQVSNNHYAVSMSYPAGNLLFRIRGVGSYLYNGVKYPLYSSWSYSADSGTQLPTPNWEYHFPYNGLEDSLTWQYTAVYAEEGKRKEVITFYDGSLRKRQEVTVNNTQDVALVGESFYDHIGRQALQSMPVPTSNRGIRYYGTVGTDTGNFNGVFPKDRYDADSTLGTSRPFRSDGGSSLYYSAANPFLTAPHWVNISQIPKDSGFTYGRIRYLSDGTDRPHSVSNPGKGFGFGSGKETRYFYGNPMQVELDRLFGNEVGEALHYQKTVTIDPNGVATVAYYDMQERLIASGLAGGGVNLLEVDSTPAKDTLTQHTVFTDSTRQYTTTILVPSQSVYDFTYHFDPAAPLCDTCLEATGCMDCRYRLIMSLWNTDLQQYLFLDTLLTHEAVLFEHVGVTLIPGSYRLYKNVETVDDEVLTAMLDSFAVRELPCTPYDTVYPEPCLYICEAMCADSCHVEPDTTNPCYDSCYYNCENMPLTYTSECDIKRLMLLADMSPGGQYFDNIRTTCPLDTNPIYDTTTQPNDMLNHILVTSLNADTNIQNLLTYFQIAGDYNALWDSMRVNWQPEYAEVMLPYHPEFYIYQIFCECGDEYELKNRFDSLFAHTYDYETAVQLGLLNPLDMPFDTVTRISDTVSLGYLPFGGSNTSDGSRVSRPCCEDKDRFIEDTIAMRLNSYYQWTVGDSTYYASLWYVLFDPDSLASGGAIPPHLDSLVVSLIVQMQDTIIPAWAAGYGCSLNDARWRLFQSSYIAIREQVRHRVLVSCLFPSTPVHADWQIYSPEFTAGQGDYYRPLYPESATSICDNLFQADTSCRNMALTVAPYSGFQIRFLCNPLYGVDEENLDSLIENGQLTLYDNCLTECASAANGWMRELNDYFTARCPGVFLNDSTLWHALRDSLIGLCNEGCELNLANGDFTIGQLLNLTDYAALLGDFQCPVDSGDYIRIVYQRPEENLLDCGCDNYREAIDLYGLTYWSDTTAIRDSLLQDSALIGAAALRNMEMGFWNSFCIWSRYDSLLHGSHNDSLALVLWETRRFPDYFRCSTAEIDWLQQCEAAAQSAADAQNALLQAAALDDKVKIHKQEYLSHCMLHISEEMTINYTSGEFLYTLYYYDQAGNLIKTVPPAGVRMIRSADTLAMVVHYRDTVSSYRTLQPGFIHPKHVMVTDNRYNTLDQPLLTYMPDHDSTSTVYYDVLSRPVLSQNGKQRSSHTYSYTRYDKLGRITEVGQVQNSTVFTREDLRDTAFVSSFINSGIRTEVTKTYYDRALVSSLNQTRLRNRIAAVTYNDRDTSNTLIYQTATHYSYDVHGNVQQLIQDIPELSIFTRRYVKMDYEYDLISGNVNRVWYQQGQAEQWMHRYRYDADNRLTHVFTGSRKNMSSVLPERLEARYFYLPHGTLVRIETGEKQVQGTDYAYTLQGWIKNVNGYKTDTVNIGEYDIGKDAMYCDSTPNPNCNFAADAAALMLQYYQNDYSPIAGNNYYNLTSNSATDLYNGNISCLSTDYYTTTPLLKSFRYDKLNRIKWMQTAGISAGEWGSLTDNFSTEYRYDYNGNILSLQRLNANAVLMHQINYTYNAKNNRLQAITAVGINSSTYGYDVIGNLANDSGENVGVTWNAMNKVKQINLPNNRQLQFSYSPTGQRQIKKSTDKTEYYLHDATGNIMCIYELSGNYLTVKERTIYGSKRIGVYRQRIRFGISSSFIQVSGTGLINILHPQPVISPDGRHYLEGSNRLQVIGANQRIVSNTTMPYSYKKGTPELKGLSPAIAARPTFLDGTKTAGLRDYELTDHLSNVMAVISDRKLSVDTNYDNITDYYAPQVVSYTDYYPFGFPMTERSGNLSGYRFGFNGQESDNEVYGAKQSYSFEFRNYDARLGRWWGIDPLKQNYSGITPYEFSLNTPIWAMDPDGRIIIFSNKKSERIFNRIYNASNSETKAKLDVLRKSDVIYYVNVKTSLKNKEGSTEYNFKENRLDVLVDKSAKNQIGTLAEELTHASQFEEGKIGYTINKEGVVRTLGYDMEDEVASKRAYIEATKLVNAYEGINLPLNNTITAFMEADIAPGDNNSNMENYFNTDPSARRYLPEFDPNGKKMGIHIPGNGNNAPETFERAIKKGVIEKYIYRESQDNGNIKTTTNP